MMSTCFAIDVYYKTVKETPIYSDTHFLEVPLKSIPINTIVKLTVSGFYRDEDPLISFYYENKEYCSYENNFIPLHSESMFDTNFLISSTVNKRYWYLETAVNALMKEDPEIIKKDIPKFEKPIDEDGNGYYAEWYDPQRAGWVKLVFCLTNNVLLMGDGEVLPIVNLIHTDYGYRITCANFVRDSASYSIYPFSFNSVSDKDFFDLRLHIDGDYIDVYLEDQSSKLFTLVAVDEVFNEQFMVFSKQAGQRAITFNKKKIQWPIRASDLGGKGLIYHTIDRLRLRISESRTSKTVTTLDTGVRMILLSKGAEATIDGITAPWVRVKTVTGDVGWCFGGYLEPRP